MGAVRKKTIYIAVIAERDEDGEMYNAIFSDGNPAKVVEKVNKHFCNEELSGHGVPEADFDDFSKLDGFDSFDEDCLNHYHVSTSTHEVSYEDMSKAAGVLETSRLALKATIIANVKRIYDVLKWDTPDFGNDEEYSVDVADFEACAPRFQVSVTDLQTDYEGVETRTVSRIKVALDDSVFVETEEEEGGETNTDDLTADELARIACWSELILEGIV